MNDCPNGEMRDRLPDLLHDRLAPAERSALDAHLAACADCRAELALLAAMRAALRRATAVDLAAIVRALPQAAAPARRARTHWRAAAAIAAIAIGGTSVAIVHRGQGVQPAAVVAVAPTIAAPPVVRAPAPIAVTDSGASAAHATERVAEAAPRRELAMSGTVSDLSDHELAALLKDIESLDAIPPATGDVESTSLAPAVAPARGAS